MRRSSIDRPFRDNLRARANDRANSDILDSRIRFWCDRLELDHAVRYEALARGSSVVFVTTRRGHVVVLHRIRPEELR